MKIIKTVYFKFSDEECKMLDTYLQKFGNTYDMFRVLIMYEFAVNMQNIDTINLACDELIPMSLEPITTILKQIKDGVQ